MKQKTQYQEQQATPLAAVKHRLTGRDLYMAPSELATYLAVGLQFVQVMRPVGVVETQLMQRIIDTNWRLNRAAAPHEPVRENLDRHEAHLQHLLLEMTAHYEQIRAKRIAKSGDEYEPSTCPAYQWYKQVAEIASGSRTENAQASLSQG